MIQSDSRSIPIKVRTGMNLSNHQSDFTNRPDALNVENVSKMYLSPAGELTALKEISFSVKKGELVSIVGPSGSGAHIVKYNRRTRQAHIRKRSR